MAGYTDTEAARRLLDVALGERAGLTERQISAAAAQTHVLLTIAEQLRTANLIALASARRETYQALRDNDADALFLEAHQRLTGGAS